MKKLISCFECDSEYIIEYEDGLISDEPQFCIVCKESIESEDIEEDADEE
jgi:hypothetical protein